ERDPATIMVPEAVRAPSGAKAARAVRRRMIREHLWQRREKLERDLAIDLARVGDALAHTPQGSNITPVSPARAFSQERDRAARLRRLMEDSDRPDQPSTSTTIQAL